MEPRDDARVHGGSELSPVVGMHPLVPKAPVLDTLSVKTLLSLFLEPVRSLEATEGPLNLIDSGPPVLPLFPGEGMARLPIDHFEEILSPLVPILKEVKVFQGQASSDGDVSIPLVAQISNHGLQTTEHLSHHSTVELRACNLEGNGPRLTPPFGRGSKATGPSEGLGVKGLFPN
jgi:hypothetical protein